MSLDALRERIAEADRALLDAWERREAAVRAIGHFKTERNLPIHDPAREIPVIAEARAGARARGLSPDAVERVLRVVIETSRARQEAIRVKAHHHGDGAKALVIGGFGRMGRWFTRFLADLAYEVTVADPAACPSDSQTDSQTDLQTVRDWREARGPDWDVTVVAAPILVSARILEEMARDGWPGLVFDIGSVKAPLLPALGRLAAAGVRVASVHPMFGPDVTHLHGRHILVMDAGHAEAAEEAAAVFRDTMAEILHLPLEEHDALIAYVLGLSHALNLAFLDALRTSGEQAPRLARISSVTFDRQLRVAAGVSGENPDLYFEIQRLNPDGAHVLARLANAVERLRRAVAEGEGDTFRGLMQSGRAWVEARHPPGSS